MKRSRVVLLAAALVLSSAFSGRACAEISSLCSAADSDSYITKASGQFTRGIVNMGFCWIELIHQPGLELKPEMGGNLFRGLGRGVGHTLLRAAKGVGDIFTAFLPPHEDGTYEVIVHDCAFGIMGLEER